MKNLKQSPVMTGILFLLAAVLLFAGTVGGTQAALTVKSNNYYSAFDLDHIGVTLYENGTAVAFRNYGNKAASGFTEKQGGNLVLNSLGDDKDLRIGKQYPFEIMAQNTGTIDQYVRVTIRKYWVEQASAAGSKDWFHGDSGTKILDEIYQPKYIQLGYKGAENSYNSGKWVLDSGSHTEERDIYYYNGILEPGASTEPLFDSLSISKSVAKECVKTTETTADGKIKTTYTYAYDGYAFVVEAEVDAVQTHHASKAMTNAWGTSTSVMSQIGVPNE